MQATTVSVRERRWVRPVLVLLAVPNLVAGLWAVIAPASWFEEFPGWAPSLVAAFPPYNEHLATDAGSGLFAAGVLALFAAVWPRRDVVLTAMVGYLAFAGPHALFHLAHPSELLTTGEDVVNTASLVVAVVASAAVMGVAWRMPVERGRGSA